MLRRILKLHSDTVEKVLSISDVCLGNTIEELGPMCHIFNICALKFFLNISTFIELNFMKKIVVHSKIKWFVFIEYCIFKWIYIYIFLDIFLIFGYMVQNMT